MMRNCLVLSTCLIASRLAFAMTQAELQEVIDAAEAGATVEVTSDVSISSALSFNRAVTLRSATGQANVISRSENVTMASVASADADVRFENLVFDGSSAAGRTGCFAILSAGKLTFGAGTTVRNVALASGGYGGIRVEQTSCLVMEDGAEIRNFSGSNYAHGVLVGE